MKMKTHVVKRLRLLTYLKSRGYLPYRVQPDINNPAYNVWLYWETPELLNAIEDYYHSDEFLNRNN